MPGFEEIVENAAIKWFEDLGYSYLNGMVIAPDGTAPERAHFGVTMLEGRFRTALERINPHLPSEALDEAARKILRPASPSLEENNAAFHGIAHQGH